MDNIIERYFSNELTAKEKEHFFEAMKSDLELKKQFISYQNVISLTGLHGQDDDVVKSKKALLRQKRMQRNTLFVKNFKSVSKYAAVLAVGIIATWMIMDLGYKNSRQTEIVENKASVLNEIPAYQELNVPAGQRASLTLPDGTVVWVNAKSRLRYPSTFGKDVRKVELDGEAYFDVAKNEDVPFVVSSNKFSIKVIGTKFGVFDYGTNSDYSASLLEGSIELYTQTMDSKIVTLAPNERVEHHGGNKIIRSKFTNTDFLLWKDGIYAFDNTSLREIAGKLELYYDTQIIIKYKNIADVKISGKFRQRDGIENAIKKMQIITGFKYRIDEDSNTITIY